MNKKDVIEFELTEEQIIKLSRLFKKVADMDSKNRPGMLLAQVSRTGRIRCGFIPNREALAIQKLRGAKPGTRLDI